MYFMIYFTGLDLMWDLWYNIVKMKIYYEDAQTTLYQGDCKEVLRLLPSDLVHLILTDPPYTLDTYYPAYNTLATESPRIMKWQASLVTLVGQYLVGEVSVLFHKRLKLNWIIWMNQPAVHARMKGFGVEVTGMPNLWYVKGRGKALVEMPDSFTLTGTDGIFKQLHPWQKDLSWADYFISHLTKPGDIVLDPFCGSGTTLVSARNQGRIGIGVEIEEKHCAEIVRRLNG